MIKGLLFIISLICSFSMVYSQAPVFQKVWETMQGGKAADGGIGNDFFLEISGDLIFAITSHSSNPSGTKQDPNCQLIDTAFPPPDMWAFKLDSNGNKLWDRTFGGLQEDACLSFVKQDDDNYYLIGISNSKPSCEKTQNRYSKNPDGWIVKMNKDSGLIWDRRFGTLADDLFYDGVVTNDNYLLIGAYSASWTPQGDVTDTFVGMEDIWILKIDSNGNKIWDRILGSYEHDQITAVLPLSNSQYFIAAYTDGEASGDLTDSSFSRKLDPTYFKEDNWLIKIDSSGNKIWDRRYGCLTADDRPGSVILNSDGDIVVSAGLYMYSYQANFQPCFDGVSDTVARGAIDCWIYKIDTANGNIINEKRFGGPQNEGIAKIIEMPDKSYLLLCGSNSNAGFEKSENRMVDTLNPLNSDIWLVKMDSAFNIIWDKTIGGEGIDRVRGLVALDDSTFIISCQTSTGNSGDIGLPTIDTLAIWNNAADIWISKWKIVDPNSLTEINLASFNLYPNPTQDVVYITLQHAKKEKYHMHVQNMQGAAIAEQTLTYQNKTITVSTAAWPPGVYVINIEGVNRKLVKL